MSDSTLKQRLGEAMKDAMRAKDRERLATIRLIQAAIKQVEVDERIEVDDTRVLSILDKMLKQRRDSVTQFVAAGRTDLSDREEAEIVVIQEFMPQALSSDELDQLVADAVAESGAASMQEMGKVMAILKPQVQGRADMGDVSRRVKEKLAG